MPIPDGSDGWPPGMPGNLRSEATRVRRLAHSLADDAAVPRLLAYAEDLDARAAAIEARGA